MLCVLSCFGNGCKLSSNTAVDVMTMMNDGLYVTSLGLYCNVYKDRLVC